MDTVYPFLALFALYLADTGLRSNKSFWFFWAGLVMSITTYMSPINFAVVALIVLYIFLIYVKERGSSYVARSLWWDLSIFGVGVLSIWLFFWIFFGVSIIELTLKLDRDTIILGRSYWFWLVGDLVDFFLFGGFAAVLLASSWPFIKRYAKLPQAVPALAISFWLMLLLLNLSGLIRGETGRIWLMLTPFPALLAAAWIKYVTYEADVNNNVLMTRLINSGLLILLATAALAYAITMRWQVISLGWPSPK